MSMISPIDFMKFCISQGFEFVLVDDDNKLINKNNADELDLIMPKKKDLTRMSMNKSDD